ncbi:MAG: ATP-binding protein, partial [Pseudonocardia sp.]
DIINQLEETEQDPDALAELFRLDHLATRVRRNAESLLVLSGESPSRAWGQPVPLRDVVRAAIAETEDLERLVFIVDERPAVNGQCVTDLTHLLVELTENAVRFSPPDTVVRICSRPDRHDGGGHVVTVEDWGVGMTGVDLAGANVLLAHSPEVDLSVSQRLGFHVVARLAARHGIAVSLTDTPGSGITAVVSLPPGLFNPNQVPVAAPPRPASAPVPASMALGGSVDQLGGTGRVWGSLATLAPDERLAPVGVTASARNGTADDQWPGWWSPVIDTADTVDPVDVAEADSGYRGPAPEDSPPVCDHLDLPSPREQRPIDVGEPADVPLPATHSPMPAAHSPLSAAHPPLSAAHSPMPTARQPIPAARPPIPHAPVGDHLPRPGAVPEAPGHATDGLHRRVPQANLAPELRQALPAADSDAPVGHTVEAASALSRYQASRRSAQAMVGDGFDEAPPPLVSGQGS